METIIKGGNLMIFAAESMSGALSEPKSIPLATSHTLRISSDSQDVSNKDVASGLWSANEVSQFSWEATTDNLYCDKNVSWLFECMSERKLLQLYFAPKTEADGTELPASGSWEADVYKAFTGKAYITSLEITAQNGENATLSATFTGYGKLESNYSDETGGSSNTGGSGNTGGNS